MMHYYHEMRITDMRKEKNIITFLTDSQSRLIVTPISDYTVEIWADYSGHGRREKSYSIDKKPDPFLSFETLDNGEYYIIKTSFLAVRVYKDAIRLEYYKADNCTLLSADCAMGWDDDGKVFLHHRMNEKEHFYGLGEDNDSYLGSLDRRGTVRDMITGQRINIGHVTADIPVTFFMSTNGNNPYGMFVDNSYHMTFDMGKSSEDEYYWASEGGDLLFYFFAQEHLKGVLNEYTVLTGKPELPPLWTLGYIQCKCSYYSWDEIDEIIETLRDNRIPLDCIVFDYDWAEYFNNYKWNKRWNNDSKHKIADYKKQGLHFMVSNSGPMLKKDSDTFPSALKAGILATDKDGNTVTCGHYGGELLDYSNPAMKAWLQPQLNHILEDGIESWWLDLTEPEGDPDGTQYYDGDKSKVHNSFSLLCTKLYHKISLEYDSNKRPFILTRTGNAGIQKYSSAIWSGDVFSDYKTFQAHVPEALNTCMSGISLWTSDSGGFMSSTNNAVENKNIYKNDVAAHANLYERWMQFSCFCPITRAHHAGESAPYVFNGLMTDSVAHYIRLRYRLLPYLYSYNYNCHLTGTPFMRPLVMDYPEDEKVYNIKDEYLFGSELLVAPVLEENVSKRSVYFPEGNWYDYDYGYSYEGGKSYEIYAPQHRIPLFVKAGAIIPMTPQIYNTKELDWKNIDIEIYPSGDSKFMMYSDDGFSYNYKNGSSTITNIFCKETSGIATEIELLRSNNLFSADSYTFQLHTNAIPEAVNCCGMSLERFYFNNALKKSQQGWFYDGFKNQLFVKISEKSLMLQVIVTYTPDSLIRHPMDHDEDENIIGQLPYLLPPASLPCRINFENFDRGGEGVAYHKEEAGNTNQIYRKDGVNIVLCDDIGCGYHVSGIRKAEWLEYTVNVRTTGYYDFMLRIRSEENSKFSIDVNSQNRSGLINDSLTKWHDISVNGLSLSVGEQVLRIFVHEGQIDGNWMDVTLRE